MKTIIKIPWDSGCMNINKGTSNAPEKILKELENIFCNENGHTTKYKTDEVTVVKNNFEETNTNIENKIKSQKDNAIIIGGDHSISYASVKGFASNHNNPGLIMLDAHPDCESDFMPPTHEDFIRGLINSQILKPQNIILIGIRNWHEDEVAFLKKHDIKVITMKEISFGNLSDIIDIAMEKAMSWDATYISVDIDIADASICPGTGYPEVGGVSSRELIYIIQRLKHLKNLKLVDLVEINPTIDIKNITVKLGAKIIKELL